MAKSRARLNPRRKKSGAMVTSSREFENGGTQKFVSQIGTLVSGSVAGTTASTAGVSNNTVSTEDLKTGISVTVNGSYESGVVFASLEIKTTDLVKITSVDSGAGVQLQLPQTNDRTVNTVLPRLPLVALISEALPA